MSPFPQDLFLRKFASKLTMQVMTCIYRMTEVNYDHLAAYVLKYYPWRRLSTFELMERLFLASDESS